MAAVHPAPFAIGLVVALTLFAGFTYALVLDARRPLHVRPAHVRPGPVVDDRLLRSSPSHTRVAVVCVVFAIWSLWATARPVSGWR
jgi:hypothetical protein